MRIERLRQVSTSWVGTVLVAVVLVTGSRVIQAQPPDRAERHRVPADFMTYQGAPWLERDERVAEEQPDVVLETMALVPGDVVADIGCGSGYYARRIAPLVPEGRVYCVDIQPEMLEIMDGLAREEGASGIVPVLSEPDDPKLPAGEINWIILADVYHEMSDYEAMLAGMLDALAPGGRVALLEYRIEDGTGDNLKADHAMSVRQVLAEWLPAGFVLTGLHEFLPGQHLFIMGVEGDPALVGAPLRSVDLFDGLGQGGLEAAAIGAGEESATVRIRKTSHHPVVVTMPVGVSFGGEGGRSEMISRRDAAILLDDDEWHDWSIRSAQWHRRGEPVGANDQLEMTPPSGIGPLDQLMYTMQVGTYRVADSPLLYLPRAHSLEQAAVWIAAEDLRYDDIVSAPQDRRLPVQYAVAFALVYCDVAGIDVTQTRVWADRDRIFGRLRDPGLNAWYREKTGQRGGR